MGYKDFISKPNTKTRKEEKEGKAPNKTVHRNNLKLSITEPAIE
jgi:RNA recognition motif-containing protein